MTQLNITLGSLTQTSQGPTLSITEGPVTIDDLSSQYNLSPDNTIITDYQVKNRYVRNARRYMLGMTSQAGFNGNSVAFVQLSNATTLWISDWTALKLGAQPEIPNSDSGDPNWVFLFAIPELVNIVLADDGVTPYYRVTGTYVYGALNPKANLWDETTFPMPPWILQSFDRTMPSSKLTNNLINNPQSVSPSQANSPGNTTP